MQVSLELVLPQELFPECGLDSLAGPNFDERPASDLHALAGDRVAQGRLGGPVLLGSEGAELDPELCIDVRNVHLPLDSVVA